jgi:PAS domain S-box-containing protein
MRGTSRATGGFRARGHDGWPLSCSWTNGDIPAWGAVSPPISSAAVPEGTAVYGMGSGGRQRVESEKENIWRAFDRVADAVVVAARSGTIEYANPAAHELFGDGATYGVGRARVEHCGVVSPNGFSPAVEEFLPLSRALRGESIREVAFLVRNALHPNGVWVGVTAAPRFDNADQITGAVAIFRKKTQNNRGRESEPEELEDLRFRVKRLGAVFDHALDAVLLADDSMDFIDVNPSACALLGYSRDELLRMNIAEITSPEQRDGVGQQWTAFLAAGTAEGELRLRHKNGARIEAEFRAVAHILPSLHLSVIRDISDRKRAEATLRETQRTDTVGMLASGAAHDFNNLLVGIIGNASLALEQLAADGTITPLVRDILAAGERAAQLSRQMLVYAGKGVPIREAMNLSEAVREIGSLIQSTIPKRVEVEYQLGNVPAIDADSGQIQQVIMNLIINAGQAIYEQTPGKITIRTASRLVRELDEDAAAARLPMGEYVALEVEDTGRGMDEDTRQRVFEPFFTTKTEGKGLGLATVRTIIRDHGGAILVRSAPGRGTCFTVLFPASVTAGGAGAEDASEGVPERPLRILIIDNEKLVQKMAKVALERVGHSVTVLSDGRDALSLLASVNGNFDAVLLDLGLPGVSPRDLAAEIQRLRPDIRIIPSTGSSETEVRGWLEGVVTSGFIQKPYTAAQLQRGLRHALG